jgi:hemerythrin-like domain-containing protein
MQIYEALKNDHEKVKELLNRLVMLNEGEEETFSALVEDIRDELIPHSRAEEAVFYNSIRAINSAQDLVWHGYEEHMMAETMLRSLQAMDKIGVESKKIAKKLKSALEHHIQEEEGKIFTVAKQLFTDKEAEVMSEAFNEMKPEVKEGNLVQTTLDMIANMMPPRLAAPLRTFTYRA